MAQKTFCEILKEKRLSLRLSLRGFCNLAGEDPANYSRIERGLRIPPSDEVLERYGKALQLSGEELKKFMRIGILFRRELPKTLSDEELAGKLPALLRAIDGVKPSEQELELAAHITQGAFRP